MFGDVAPLETVAEVNANVELIGALLYALAEALREKNICMVTTAQIMAALAPLAEARNAKG